MTAIGVALPPQSDSWQLPDGVQVLGAAETALLESLRRELLDLFHCWGYDCVSLPLLEYSDSWPDSLGQDLRRLGFVFSDPLSDRDLRLRADITPQTARLDARSEVAGVTRLCYGGPVVHRLPRRWQATREPFQMGAELYGDRCTAADAELIALMMEAAVLAECRRPCLDLGHVGIYRLLCRRADLDAAVEKRIFNALQCKSTTDLKAAMPADLPSELADPLMALAQLHGDESVIDSARLRLGGCGSEVIAMLDELERVLELLHGRLDSLRCYIDLGELRGYRYHTGLVFAVYADGHGAPLANGGRYDGMGAYFGRGRPAAGFSTELHALCAAGTRKPAATAAIFVAAENLQRPGCAARVGQLRNQGHRVICGLERELPPDRCDRCIEWRDGEWQLVDIPAAQKL